MPCVLPRSILTHYKEAGVNKFSGLMQLGLRGRSECDSDQYDAEPGCWLLNCLTLELTFIALWPQDSNPGRLLHFAKTRSKSFFL